ncbi:SDR family oxidoreductase [Alphaproteobacteria bacterium]|nr:SDR family oxidoreductase [Alphaproteobacteria bacterium]
MKKVLVTGASGFIGRALSSTLLAQGHAVSALVRSADTIPKSEGLRVFEVKGLDLNTDLLPALSAQQVVVHTAARTHIMKDDSPDPLTEYRRVNVTSTVNIARKAAEAGVNRFIFISSIKVNGEHTLLGQPFSERNVPAPEDAYGISKYEAEQGLLQIAAETGLEIVIIRPPLVYGAGVKGNFSSIIKFANKGIPLPLRAIENKRSFIALDNLLDLIITCFDHPLAANQVFLAGDGEDLSTTELLQSVAKAAGVSSRLFPVPTSILMLAASIVGKKAVAQRLLNSLQIDISKARDLLGWTPPLSIDEGLRRCFVDKRERY